MAASGGALSIRPEPPAPAKAVVGRAAGDALAEIERGGDAPFRAAEGEDPAQRLTPQPSGTWTAIEPGREPVARPPILPSIAPAYDARPAAPPPPMSTRDPAPVSLRLQASAPQRPADMAREVLLLFPRDLPISRHASGAVLVHVTNGFATRLEAVRSLSAAARQQSTVLQRRARGRVMDEPLGGSASPVVELSGKVELVLGPAVGQKLVPIALEEDALYLREDALTGFESGLSWENGRLPVGDGDALPMVQLRGPGTVVASLPENVAAVEVIEGHSTAVRAASVLGWVGRVVPRALLASEAPGGVRGFVAFAGEGMVLLHER
jgi:uncharacterized protein (AIM24 family)